MDANVPLPHCHVRDVASVCEAKIVCRLRVQSYVMVRFLSEIWDEILLNWSLHTLYWHTFLSIVYCMFGSRFPSVSSLSISFFPHIKLIKLTDRKHHLHQHTFSIMSSINTQMKTHFHFGPDHCLCPIMTRFSSGRWLLTHNINQNFPWRFLFPSGSWFWLVAAVC